MPPVKQKPADLLTLIADRAFALRKAGVQRVELDGMAFTLLPYHEPPASVTERTEMDVEESDPLLDPATFGLAPGSRLPGFTREDEEEQWATNAGGMPSPAPRTR